jgi:YggT family protein
MSEVLRGVADVLQIILQSYKFVVIVAVLLQLVNADPYNAVVAFFRQITEPCFLWIRRKMPFVVVGAVDLSPLVVIIAIVFLEHALVGNLYRWAAR